MLARKKILVGIMLMGMTVMTNSAELVSLNTRENVEQKFIFMAPESAKASVILFAGGKGALKLSADK